MDAKLFVEGSIYFYENRTNTKKDYEDPELNHDFLVSRPVYILDSNPVPFDMFTVNVLAITSSQNRAGISVNVNGYRDGKILPYAIHSLHRENLVRYMGQVSEEMRDEVRQAVAYHMNFITKEPKYLTEYRAYRDFRKKFIISLSTKEKCLYDVFSTMLLFDSDYYMSIEEFFQIYHKSNVSDPYDRNANVSRTLRKIIENIYPRIQIMDINQQKVVLGCSVIGKIHRKGTDNDPLSRGIRSETSKYGTDVEELNTREELLEAIHPTQKKVYESLDMVMKLKNYRTNPDNFSFNTYDQRNARIMKKLLLLDVDEEKERVGERLKEGESPLNMSQHCQVVIFYMSDSDIRKYCDKKYYKHGIKTLKKKIHSKIYYLIR